MSSTSGSERSFLLLDSTRERLGDPGDLSLLLAAVKLAGFKGLEFAHVATTTNPRGKSTPEDMFADALKDNRRYEETHVMIVVNEGSKKPKLELILPVGVTVHVITPEALLAA